MSIEQGFMTYSKGMTRGAEKAQLGILAHVDAGKTTLGGVPETPSVVGDLSTIETSAIRKVRTEGANEPRPNAPDSSPTAGESSSLELWLMSATATAYDAKPRTPNPREQEPPKRSKAARSHSDGENSFGRELFDALGDTALIAASIVRACRPRGGSWAVRMYRSGVRGHVCPAIRPSARVASARR